MRLWKIFHWTMILYLIITINENLLPLVFCIHWSNFKSIPTRRTSKFHLPIRYVDTSFNKFLISVFFFLLYNVIFLSTYNMLYRKYVGVEVSNSNCSLSKLYCITVALVFDRYNFLPTLLYIVSFRKIRIMCMWIP